MSYKQLFDNIASALHVKKPNIELKKEYKLFFIFLVKIINWFKPNSTLTPETVNTSLSRIEYSNQKIKESIGFKFTPICETIKQTGRVYLEK